MNERTMTMSRKYHLLRELGITKQTLRYCLRDAMQGNREFLTKELQAQTEALIARRGMMYSLEELDLLAAFFCTGHDEHCHEDVCDEDCTNLVIWRNQRRFDRAMDAIEIIESIREMESRVDGQ